MAPESAAVADSPPLGIYLHVPWCVRKCPYCDFNSHAVRGDVPVDAYLDALRADIDSERAWLDTEALTPPRASSVFIGGGTPSLMPAAAIAEALSLLEAAFGFAHDAEVTLEANPGASDAGRFAGFRAAGVNRLSIGVQSFDDARLAALGRVHDGAAARAAIEAARSAGFERLNADLMYALPAQDADAALADVECALGFGVTHLSHYQLTLEPNTAFAVSPPSGLPDEDTLLAIEATCRSRLADAGFERYEVSAFARAGEAARHNLNYWRFGDYLGLGPGAHGKLTHPASGAVTRSTRRRHPREWLDGQAPVERNEVLPERLAFEFALNALRLTEGFDRALFEARTGLGFDAIAAPLARGQALGLLEDREAGWVRPTPRGRELLNDVQALFL